MRFAISSTAAGTAAAGRMLAGAFLALAIAPDSTLAGLEVGFGAASEATMSPAAIGSAARIPDPSRYDERKRASDVTAGFASAPAPDGAAATTHKPTVLRRWEGLRGKTAVPTDSTSAIGTTRFIEVINSSFAIFDRTSDTPISTGSLGRLAGCRYCNGARQADPQVMWDAQTSRFYLVYLEIGVEDEDSPFPVESGNALLVAYSKTSTPNGPDDWCRYYLDFFDVIPDYPKLGDTSNFLLMGINAFQGEGGNFVGAGVSWISKPPAGDECPEPETFRYGIETLDGATTPVPANQIDKSSTGYIVATPGSAPTDKILLYRATRGRQGQLVLPEEPEEISVPQYDIPANAPQKDSFYRLDTLDGRFTQGVSAIDPQRGGRVGFWTQHTVAGGAGAEVRWYEIDAENATLFQSGTVTNSKQYVFNGAISPDRVRRKKIEAFGSNMVLHFNASSEDQYVGLYVTSKIGSQPVSGVVQAGSSLGPERTFDCQQSFFVCRWGDYAGASPDPKAAIDGASGRVWGTSMLAIPTASFDGANWRTRNLVVKP
jgi:hypothetical protein